MRIAVKSETKRKLQLFLDFDGVLHPYVYGPSENDLRVRPERLHPNSFSCLGYLQETIRNLESSDFDVRIHFATTWRSILPADVLANYLGAYLARRVIGSIPTSELHQDRDWEIVKFIRDANLIGDQFLIIDDNPDLYENLLKGSLRDRLYVTNPDTGMTQSDIEKIVSAVNVLAGTHS